MCLGAPKIPDPPAPPPVPQRADAEQLAEQARQRLSVRQGYASQIKTGPDGSAGFGTGGQVPSISGGTATTLGGS